MLEDAPDARLLVGRDWTVSPAGTVESPSTEYATDGGFGIAGLPIRQLFELPKHPHQPPGEAHLHCRAEVGTIGTVSRREGTEIEAAEVSDIGREALVEALAQAIGPAGAGGEGTQGVVGGQSGVVEIGHGVRRFACHSIVCNSRPGPAVPRGGRAPRWLRRA